MTKPKNLYAVLRNGSKVPHLIADDITSIGDFPWSEEHRHAKIVALKEGESTVLEGNTSQSATWRITRLPDFRMNRVVFDEHAKEYVILSNGRSLDVRATHETFVPSEAIALRPLTDGAKVSIAWTYRAVDPVNLRPVKTEDETRIKSHFQAIMSKRRSARFVGRI